MQVRENDLIGAVKIKDGLFMGDVYASQDIELMMTNKITRIINCAGMELPNHWEHLGILYLSLPWQETDYQVLYEGKNDVLGQIYKFIEIAMNKGEGVLVHSIRGQNRSCCAIAAYCMKKYKWTLYKTIEFLQSKKPDMTIRPNFFNQLTNLESRLSQVEPGNMTYNWDEINDNPNNIESEELLIANTFLNSKPLPLVDFNNLTLREYRPNKVMWIDQHFTTIDSKSGLASAVSAESKVEVQTSPKDLNKESDGKSFIKSILKGSDKVFYLDENTNKQERNSARYSKGFSEKETPRKGMRKLRPSSATALQGKAPLAKSSSTPQFEKVDQNLKIPSIQGNIINITVNNYITNNVPNSLKENVPEESKLEKGICRSRLFDNVIGSNKDVQLGLKKSNSLTTFTGEKNIHTINLPKGEDVFVSSAGRNINYQQDPIDCILQTGGLTVQSSGFAIPSENSKGHPNFRKLGHPFKAFKMDDTKSISNEKSAAVYGSNIGMIKYLNSTRAAPIKVNEIDINKNPGNFIPKNKRPIIAPSIGSKKEISPYYNPENYSQSNKYPKESKNGGQAKVNSNREGPKMFAIKTKIRGPLPVESHYDGLGSIYNPTPNSSQNRFQIYP